MLPRLVLLGLSEPLRFVLRVLVPDILLSERVDPEVDREADVPDFGVVRLLLPVFSAVDFFVPDFVPVVLEPERDPAEVEPLVDFLDEDLLVAMLIVK